ncbi:BQ2448_6500 [Microbotryum intermedium]|uniref:BQ2448_6500 protein n=1 Tax=Microbotryum intermedium TaxID=269621 RepID=A0A238FS61_9BASI|nr:BQ2448_6500 [Microbotryum intermedium]
MGGESVDLRSMRMPFGLSSNRMRPGLLGTTGGRGLGNSSSSSRSCDKLSRKRQQGSLPSKMRISSYTVMFALLVLGIFWNRYQLHIEIQAYRRGWIRRNIDPVPPLSGTCFNPARIAATDYNATLAHSPKYVELHAGLSMQLGDDCFAFASTVPRAPVPGMNLPRRTIFHTYWRDDLKPLGARQIALLDSILAMQDRETSTVILWTNAVTTERLDLHPLLSVLLKRYSTTRLVVRSVDKKALAQGTPMEGHKLLDLADQKAWLDGDLVRLLVLWSEGGIWVDFDTIMTGRDTRVLGEHEWVTQWDCYDKIYQPLNGAMMHFLKHSPYLCEMLYAMANDPPPRKDSTDWGSRLYYKVFRRLIAEGIAPFKILPFCFTDGVTCRLDNRLPDPFASAHEETKWSAHRRELLEKKVRNVWAVHLHNQWEKGFHPDGWVDRLIMSRIRDTIEREYSGE